MTRLKDLLQEAPVHERRLELRTYPLQDDRVIVEGWLRDERFVSGYAWDGQPRLPGVIHWMCVRLLVGDWPLTILDAEVEMPVAPHELCPPTLEAVKKIIGLHIVAGYTDGVRKRLGGIEGCTHLTQLVTSMGPAALHGYWAQRSRRRFPVPPSRDEFPALKHLLNSCRLWREGGPLIEKVQRTIEEAAKENAPAKNDEKV